MRSAALILIGLVLLACSEDPPPDHSLPSPLTTADLTQRLVYDVRLRDEFSGEPASGPVDAERLEAAAVVLRGRLARTGHDSHVRIEDEGIVVALPDMKPAALGATRERLERWGRMWIVPAANEKDEQDGDTFDPEAFKRAGAPSRFRWCPAHPQIGSDELGTDGVWVFFAADFWPSPPAIHADPARGFTNGDVHNVRRGRDHQGGGTVDFEIADSKQVLFHDYTKSLVGRDLAIIVDGALWMQAHLLEPLRSQVQISRMQGYSASQQDLLLDALQLAPLEVCLTLRSHESDPPARRR